MPPRAVKIGMVSSPEIILEIVENLKKYNPKYLVVDPVMISKLIFTLSDILNYLHYKVTFL
ncbi:bifunctional hydroxymethylpyrimidine kinase/phosphomethylpyrimidine kinase [Clostridioides difficile]